MEVKPARARSVLGWGALAGYEQREVVPHHKLAAIFGQPLRYSIFVALFEAFPSEAVVSFWEPRWAVPEGLLAELPW